jgi:myo-inositol 2-dehydrogenase/D-chiro-inositol 1-dehydrogenase
MAMTLADCDRMIEACDRAGVKLMIGHVRRFDSDWGTFRRLVQAGVIGRPVLWRQTAGSGGPGRWFMDARMGGGPFLDGAVHNWDFANWCFGEPVEALGSIMRFRDSTALDTGAVVVRYASGDEVMLSWSWGLPRGCSAGGTMEALGPAGVITFPTALPPNALPEGFDHKKWGAYLVNTGDRKRLERFRKRNMFAEEWKDFYRGVARGAPLQVTGEVARRAVAVGLAVLKTGATRRRVKVAK